MSSGQPPSLSFAFTGDLALGGDFLAAARPSGEDPDFHLGSVRPSLADADVVVINLEGPIGKQGLPRSSTAALLHNESAVIDWLKSFPLPVCNLANNHMMDYGPDALRRTLRLLRENGILYLGAGENREQAEAELIFVHGGLRLGMLSGTSAEPHVGATLATEQSPGCAEICVERLCARVADLASRVDIVAVNLHWGYEFYQHPAPSQVETCRKLADAGATLVIGHHPHVWQGVEERNGSVIAYSLGNLLLPPMTCADGRVQYRKPITRQYMIFKAQATPHKVSSWEALGGTWSADFRLIPHQGAARAAFDAALAAAAQVLQGDYPQFWAKYDQKRAQELQMEAITDLWGKLRLMGVKAALSRFSLRDVNRLLRRMSSFIHQQGNTGAAKLPLI